MPTDVHVIEVLGPGCARCHETHRVVRDVVEEARLDCQVHKSESMDRMVELGVLKTPAVASTERSSSPATSRSRRRSRSFSISLERPPPPAPRAVGGPST
jgi:hypothetical protein